MKKIVSKSIFDAYDWFYRDYSWSGDTQTVILSFIEGASEVLNRRSMAQFCVKNATEIPSTLTNIYNTIFNTDTRVDGITSLMLLLKYFQGTSFNCFYSIFDFLQATGIRGDLNPRIFFWNLMFNFGFFYSDVKIILQFWYYKKDTAQSDLISWKRLAKAFGDFTTRLFYSRYYPSRLENFFTYL